MKKFGRALMWVVINSLLAFMGYLGYYEDIDGFRSVFMLFAWFTVISAFLVALATLSKDFKRKEGRSVWSWVSNWYDIVMAGVMAYNGLVLMSGLWLLHIVFLTVYYEKDVTKNEEKEESME